MSLAMKARQKVKKKTIKDKVFGCNLVEHLQLSGQEVPQVLKNCTEFVEEHGVVDGIYRLCGIASNVQKLRQEFDMERTPDLNKSTYLQDVHCVSSLCKAYFRELPNPLLTYQLYDKFADAVAIQLEEQRLIKIREVLKELPSAHYRTLQFLMRHLVFMASFSSQTNMHARNLAIVWAPNLLRSKDIESSGFNGTAAFMEVRVQSIVVEFILTHVEQLFGVGTIPGKESEGGSAAAMNWPSCVPEEYYRSLSYNLPSMLNHGDGPPQIRPYHTIIEFSENKRKGSIKAKKWKSIFNLGRSGYDSKRKSQKQDDKDGTSDIMNLRPAKSMDSLSSVPYAPDAGDLEQTYLTRQPSKNQLPIRRDSFGAHPKQKNIGYIFADLGEQSLPMETNDAEYEEEVQAKSEPTTPKVGRSSTIGTPQGRSPKSNQNRAEKCVGVHISGPFSVTLPFHITSNLSRLTRGMEINSLNYPVFHRSSEKLFSQEANRECTESTTEHVRSSLDCDRACTESTTEHVRSSLDCDRECTERTTEHVRSSLDCDRECTESTTEHVRSSLDCDRECTESTTEHVRSSLDCDRECTESITEHVRSSLDCDRECTESTTEHMRSSLDCDRECTESTSKHVRSSLDCDRDCTESTTEHMRSSLDCDRECTESTTEHVRSSLDCDRECTERTTEHVRSSLDCDRECTESTTEHMRSSLDCDRECTESTTEHVRSSLDCDKFDISTKEDGDSKMENNQILFDVQDTFSFLDSQETSPDAIAAGINQTEEKLVKTAAEYYVDSDILEYELQRAIQMEEFSVEPPPDDPCTEDESEQMYFMPTGCPDIVQQWRETHDSLEDIYLSAYDDLSPLAIDSDGVKFDEDNKVHQESEDRLDFTENQGSDKHCILSESLPTYADPLKVLHDNEQRPYDVSYGHTDKDTTGNNVYGSLNNIPEAGFHYSLHCNLEATKENMAYTEELCTMTSEAVLDDEVNAENHGFSESQTTRSLSGKKENLDDEATVINAGSMEFQGGQVYSKDETPEDVDTVESPGPEEPQAVGSYCKDDNLEKEANLENPCHEEPHNNGLCSSNKNLGHQAAVKNLVLDYGDCNNDDNVLETATVVESGTSELVMASLSGIFLPPNHAGAAREEHWGKEESNWEEHKSICGNQLCFRDNSQTRLSSSAEGDEMIKSFILSDIMKVNPLPKDYYIPQDGSFDPTPDEFDQMNSSEEQRMSPVLQNTVISGTYPDGSVATKLASTTKKIHQAKSVPIVPPKPQFAKLPPALKSKVHVTSSLTTKPQKPEKSPADCSRDSTPKRRSSWRNATSVSFDTAMALAKERQQSQNPVRRMQTYCIGDSYEIIDSSKTDNTPYFQKITITSASSRTNRPYSFMSLPAAELELRGNNWGTEESNTLTIHGSQPILSPEPDTYTKEVPHRNRLSMPRLGRQASGNDLTDLCLQQRRSLL